MIRLRPSTRSARRTRLRPIVDRLEGRALMAFAGSLDPTFGTGGLYTAALSSGTNSGMTSVSAVAVEADGSVLEVGDLNINGSTTIGVLHLSTSGSPETSFGPGGVAAVPLPSGPFRLTSDALLVQPDGKILVVGNLTTPAALYPSTVVERFDSDGTPDASFGTAGQAIIDSSSLAGASFQYAALQTDGRIVLAGHAPIPGSTNLSTQVALTRLNADGTLDTTFGTNGVTTITDANQGELSSLSPRLNVTSTGVAIQPDGRIVVAGSVNVFLGGLSGSESIELYRLNTDGTRDTSLSETPLQHHFLNDSTANGLTVLPNGQIVIIGGNTGNIVISGASPTPVVIELNADGSVAHLTTVPTLGPSTFLDNQIPTGLGIEPNGDLVFGVNADNYSSGVSGPRPAGTYLEVVRLKPDLTPDATFGSGGVSAIALPVPTSPTQSYYLPASTIGIEPNGQIVAAGVSSTNTSGATQYNVVARLNPTGTSAHPGDYTGDGIADPTFYLSAYGGFEFKNSDGGPGGFVPLGSPGPGQSIPAPGNYYGTGAEDFAVYLPSIGYYVIKDPTGKTPGEEIQIGVPGPGQTIPAPGDYYGTGQDDVAVYMPTYGAYLVQDPTGKTPGVGIFFGIPGAGQTIPVPGDYFGTGRDDFAVYLTQSATWDLIAPGSGQVDLDPLRQARHRQLDPRSGRLRRLGPDRAGRLPARHRRLIYRPANGGADVTIRFGVTGAGQTLPAPADYDGSGKTEVAGYVPAFQTFVYRPAAGADFVIPVAFAGTGPVIPATSVSASQFLGSESVSAEAVNLPGVLGQPDPLDFLILPETTTAKKKA